MAREKKIDMVVLGLLSHEPLTGYDIKKEIDGAISFFWKGSFGNIYPTLKELEAQGLVARSAGKAEGSGREKIAYSITDSGREALKEWLNDERVSNELRYETLLKLFFGGNAGRDITLKNIEAFERKIAADLKLLKFYKGNLEKVLDDEDHVYFYLTVSFGVETYEAYLKWCAKAKKLLKERIKR
ncbi:MAG: PadR family transcriptional regulator [Lachnospiraceae bacterium]|nr:PadR family transcriptional regulator [Lachnospiraceae bacterium]MBR5762768.1 PadR family transcriptional regulator [Lachnospiraceae bacterium]